jgi:hypothetical protein
MGRVLRYPMGISVVFYRDLYKSRGAGLIGLNVGFIFEEEKIKEK